MGVIVVIVASCSKTDQYLGGMEGFRASGQHSNSQEHHGGIHYNDRELAWPAAWHMNR